jgi:hypothetical protein
MNAPVNFHNQFLFMAVKVSNVPANRMLPPKPHSMELAFTQALPKHVFRICWVLSEFPAQLDDVLGKFVFVATHRVKIVWMCHARKPLTPTPLPQGEGKYHKCGRFNVVDKNSVVGLVCERRRVAIVKEDYDKYHI